MSWTSESLFRTYRTYEPDAYKPFWSPCCLNGGPSLASRPTGRYMYLDLDIDLHVKLFVRSNICVVPTEP